MIDLTPMGAVRVDPERRRACGRGRRPPARPRPGGRAARAGDDRRQRVAHGRRRADARRWHGLARPPVRARVRQRRALHGRHSRRRGGPRDGRRRTPICSGASAAAAATSASSPSSSSASIRRPAAPSSWSWTSTRRRRSGRCAAGATCWPTRRDRRPSRPTRSASRPDADRSCAAVRWSARLRLGGRDGRGPRVPRDHAVDRQPLAERVTEMAYVELQSIADDRHHHGMRRYSKGHYLPELPDAAIEAFLSRGVRAARRSPTGRACRTAASRPTAARSPTSARTTPRSATATRWSSSWAAGPGSIRPRTPMRIAAARALARAMEPFGSGAYVNVIADEGGPRSGAPTGDAKLAPPRRAQARGTTPTTSST